MLCMIFCCSARCSWRIVTISSRLCSLIVVSAHERSLRPPKSSSCFVGPAKAAAGGLEFDGLMSWCVDDASCVGMPCDGAAPCVCVGRWSTCTGAEVKMEGMFAAVTCTPLLTRPMGVSTCGPRVDGWLALGSPDLCALVVMPWQPLRLASVLRVLWSTVSDSELSRS